MKKVTWQSLLYSVALLGVTPVNAATATFSMETAAPSGFEGLTEPTSLVVDIYYGGRLLSNNQQATISPNTLQFDNPGQIIQLLPGLLDSDVVLQRLKQLLPSNSHRSCQNYNRDRCGVVEAEVLEVIYNPELFRVDIFVGEEYLTTNAVMEDPFLPPATNRFAISQQLSGSWSGSQSRGEDNIDSNQNYTFYSNSIVSFGESSFRGLWSYSENPGIDNTQARLRVSDLYWTRDFRGKAVSAGLFQPYSNSSRFASIGGLYGVELYRSDNTRLDANLNSGTPIEVHMPVRGRVEVYREDRMIHSQMLEAGNQLISSASFPQGAYDIVVQTYSEDGRPLGEFEQFFAKDSQLPPAGQWQWNLLGGVQAEVTGITSAPKLSDEFFIQAGFGRRIVDNFGLIGGIAATDNSQLLELGARWVTNHFDVTPELVTTASGQTGARLSLLVRSSLGTLTYQDTRMEDQPGNNRDILLRSTYDFRSVSLNIPVGEGRLNARYTERESGSSIKDPLLELSDRAITGNRLQTLDFLHPILRGRNWSGNFRLGYSEGDDEQLWSLGVQFRHNKGRLSNSSYLRGEAGSIGGNRQFGGLSSSWNDGNLWSSELQQQINVEGGWNDATLRSQTRFAGRRGSVSSSINYHTAENNTLSYTGGFSTTLASDGDFFSWGGENNYNSSVLVDIDGAEDERFEILVNGSRRGYATGGDETLINVPSYDSYQISVKPLGDGFYNFQDNSEVVTIYPGNVASTRYEIKTLILIMGQITRGGDPVGGARFKLDHQSVTTDEYGLFQLEYYAAPGKRNFSYVLWNDCEIPVNEISADKNWLNLGTIDLNGAHCEIQNHEKQLARTGS